METRMRGRLENGRLEEFSRTDLGPMSEGRLISTRFQGGLFGTFFVDVPSGCTVDQRERRELGALMQHGFDPWSIEVAVNGEWSLAYRHALTMPSKHGFDWKRDPQSILAERRAGDVVLGEDGVQYKTFRDDLSLFAKYQEQVVRLHGCVCPVGAEAGCRGALCPRRGGV